MTYGLPKNSNRILSTMEITQSSSNLLPGVREINFYKTLSVRQKENMAFKDCLCLWFHLFV